MFENVMRHGSIFDNSTVKMESYNATWNNTLGYSADYNGVSNQSVAIFSQFVRNQGASISPNLF